eukprot:TRINITY_DN15257_c0_g1_i1.p1 TRINITY_DN15257_c0_g1~~TRINITY_DN15257_c0_g1_i1.p1  ORF type:complete len:561 (-),score=97.48 TRINITY_DN15257_c0_g1_i1:121-1731(-)
MSRTLFITSPNGQHQCCGQYTLQPNINANSQPVWKMESGSFWLYSGSNGMWIIGGQDAKDKNFECSRGMIYNRTLHGGATPDKTSGVWERLKDDQFVEDASITVTTTIQKPYSLRVVTPNGQQRCAGEYVLVADELANGLPLWKQKSGKCFLYCGTNGSWIIGGSDAKERNFVCSKGVIHSKRPSGGVMPDKIGGVWLRLSGSQFDEDAAITVCVKPSPLYVSSPNGQQRCAGEYVPIADRMANGYPLWEHTSGKCWLYSGSNGMWILGGNDAKAKDFQCTRGVIYCKTVHSGQAPEKMMAGWMRLDGEGFREDAAISVSTKPTLINVVSPNGQQKCAGEYVLMAGERVRGQPVWKQRRGHHRLCSTQQACWMILQGHPKENVTENPSNVVLICKDLHHGMMPDKGGPWSRLNGEKHVEDPDIQVTTFVTRPAKLHVTTPDGQQDCGGEFGLLAGETANNHPIWKQMGGKYWLYSGTNGMWIIGGNGAKKKHFECSRGVIYSAAMHGGVMPDKVACAWLRLDGEQFIEDKKITVTV